MNIYLEKIKEKRASNNELWMLVLDIALRCAPEETKSILRGIRSNDLDISKLTGVLSDEN